MYRFDIYIIDEKLKSNSDVHATNQCNKPIAPHKAKQSIYN